ncbi:serine-type D-Ala-D-Ala carboxypeptidase [Lentilactobacillus kisonensis DSM 19906 = JCM 15041]|uniref:serine-type D-Ala-D-Ala carboxypeptidase n=1 Tax=Lentilactobacillus kisonensis DSM 19906 = JCM 15041 TaxID=1423766 RepID=A0A0R1NZX2_9LACO|nr:D-alanyl-D-alanine carboxypeptidase family protein [Lentilactobacillus kisonensis]KRL22451.1 serine-type D-Ala-D-Ala carboxypeptidase [Lentilactobacillus kisonensis DSM 19906 = JCM 15041]
MNKATSSSHQYFLKWVLVASFSLAILFAIFLAPSAGAKKLPAFQAKEAYVMDAKTGQVLYQKNADTKRPIASLSKLMTLYLTKKAIDHHKIKWNQKVPVDDELIKMSKDPTLGGFKIKRSGEFTVRQLYQAALIASSNSAAIALGKLVGGGNNTQFINMMNRQAEKWGIEATFVSSSGLDNTDLSKYHYQVPHTTSKAQNMVSASAISKVAAKVLGIFPTITQWSNQSTMKVGKQWLVNSNNLLKNKVYYRKSNHVDGLKTGYTINAGLCLTVTFWHNGRHLIATIIDSDSVFTSMDRLIQQIDKNYNKVNVSLNTHRFRLDDQSVTATPEEPKTAIWRQNSAQKPQAVKYVLTKKATPVTKGQPIGYAEIKLTNSRGMAKVPMLATKDVGAKQQSKQKKSPQHKSLLASIGSVLLGFFDGIYHLMVNFAKFMAR